MNERVLLLNGTLDVQASPGHATTIEVRLPLRPAEEPGAKIPAHPGV